MWQNALMSLPIKKTEGQYIDLAPNESVCGLLFLFLYFWY